MKQVLAFDINQTLNTAQMPVTDEMARLLVACLEQEFEVCPISGHNFKGFLRQVVEPLVKNGIEPEDLAHLHLFVAQGTQYYRYSNGKTWQKGPMTVTTFPKNEAYDEARWEEVYNLRLEGAEIEKITVALETAAKELGFWHADLLKTGDEIIENRLSQVTFSGLGQKAEAEAEAVWDPDCKKREKIAARAKELLPEFEYELGGPASINAFKPGRNKAFGMERLMEELGVEKEDILYFGDMTQPGGNDYPVVKMGIETIAVRNCEDTEYALRGILGVI